MKTAERFSGIEISEIRKMNALANAETINLGIGQLPDLLPECVREAGSKAFSGGVARYTANIGDIDLRKAVIKEFNRENGLDYSCENVVITNGSQGAIWNIFAAFLNAGDKVLLPNICFSAYETIVKIHGGSVIFYKLTADFQIDIADFEACLKANPDVKFTLINSPSNPCGSVVSADCVKKFCEIANKYDNLCVISDEVYNKLYFGEIPLSPARFARNFIAVNAISKRCAATGMRVGWAISEESTIKPLVVANQYTSSCANSISQLAAVQAFGEEAENFCAKVRKDLAKNAEIVYNSLSQIPEISVVLPQGAFYCMPNISHFGTSRELALKLFNECNILTIPGIAFGADGDKFIRISFAVESEILEIVTERIKEFFRKNI